jgi:hypothetical protein
LQVDRLNGEQSKNGSKYSIAGKNVKIKHVVSQIFQLVSLIITMLILQGCVAGTIIDVVAETVEAGVELTGAAVGTVVDVIIPDSDDEDGE